MDEAMMGRIRARNSAFMASPACTHPEFAAQRAHPGTGCPADFDRVELLAYVERLLAVLSWTGTNPEFAEGGDSRSQWLKYAQPVLDIGSGS